MMTSNSRRVYFISYYLISVMLIFTLYGNLTWLTYVRLMTNGTAVNALVTETTCSNSMTFSYRFTVGEKNFSGSGGDGYGNKPCTSLKSGDTAAIWYLTSDPGMNVPGDPAARLISEFSAIALVAFFVPLLVLFLVFGVINVWQKQKKFAVS